jgi:2-dehydro-3-deoxyphosphogluconate aldolase / (4S)-4-hydroxy-2-oxoglutarate aldolase
MVKSNILDRLLSNGVFAVIRMTDTKKIKKVVEAISLGGVKNIEITMTVPNAVNAISELVKSSENDIIIGAGTVIDIKLVPAVIEAGVKFVVSPIWDINIFKECRRRDVVCVPGCYSPTEIFQAWNAGADVIKVFPATSLGPQFFKDLSGPFPNIRLMPTGGVTIANVHEWVKAGAVAIGIGSGLLDKKAIDEERYEVLTERATRLVENFQNARDKKTIHETVDNKKEALLNEQ